MLFNSYSFILVFLPIVLAGFFLFSRWRLATVGWLALSSIVFYAWWSLGGTLILAGSIVFNYLMGVGLQKVDEDSRRANFILWFGIGVNLLALMSFKYLPPALVALSHPIVIGGVDLSKVALPLGISFFTFTQIGYLIDCKSGIAKSCHPLDYVLFVTFFPHLIAGPILHHREIMPQFAEGKTFRFNPENLSVGLTLFSMGLFKKVVLADPLATIANGLFNHPGQSGVLSSWICALAYSLQLYFDFSGYSDMGIGLARLFGVKFPANFMSPYKAHNIIEFWQRWHMTLTRYLNLYLYNPLALSITRWRAKRNLPINRQAASTVGGFVSMSAIPTFVTMALAGVWHGAGLQYLLYGVIHAIYLIINHGWRIFFPIKALVTQAVWRSRVSTFVKWAITFVAVVLAQVMFRANTAGDAFHIYQGMLGLHGNDFGLLFRHGSTSGFGKPSDLAMLLGCFAAVLLLPNSNQLLVNYAPVLGKVQTNLSKRWLWQPNWVWGVIFGVVAVVALLKVSGATEFIYFQF
jgi:D-alanyl-lipoteichoic acid acyltransferase DltB (MBOAT superfamily)